MGAEYSPQATWPSHTHKAWNETLTYARQHGWSLRTYDGHTWGKVSCPTGECSVTIFSTGRSTESVARSTRSKVERCRHGGPAVDRLAQVDDRLTCAERLLDACDELAKRDEAERRLELLDEASESLEAASAEFEAVFGQMELAETRAVEAFEAAGVSPVTGADALDGAGEQIAEAERELEDEPRRDPRVRALRRRINRCRSRIEALRLPHLDAT